MNNATASTGLDVDRLLADAAREAGEGECADPAHVAVVARYCRAVNAAGLSEAGVAGQQATIHRLLVNHLRMQADIGRHPEILREEITPPVVVLGLPRTGSTKLQRMLTQAPDVQSLDSWRMLNPAPFPDAGAQPVDSRIEVSRQYLAQLAALCPEFMAIHPTEAEQCDEDVWLLHMSFRNLANAVLLGEPGFLAEIQATPHDASYAYEYHLLQYLQWQDGGGRGRPWVLKSPVHTGHLDIILKTFPGATLVHCHRDIATVMPSVCRLFEMLWTLAGHVALDRANLGRIMVKVWSTELRNHVAQREHCGVGIVDVFYDDIVDKPLDVVTKVYAARGRDLSRDAAARIDAWERANRPSGPRAYDYSLQRYALERETIDEAFAPYVELLRQLRRRPP